MANDGAFAHLVVGTAGMGKSCVLAHVINQLQQRNVRNVPFLSIRLDNLPRLASTAALGRELNLPDSPAVVLAGLSQGQRAVLVVDQLDAMSVVSGRNTELWEVFDELVHEIRLHPNLRLLMACRAFDLEHDPRLARLVKPDGLALSVALQPLSPDVVTAVVRECGGQPDRFSERELELLRTPFHLHLFLQGDPTNPKPFGGRHVLFARFWVTKRRRANDRGADFERGVGMLTEALSQAESVSVPSDRLDLVAPDAKILASENVLVLENDRYRFFHETFFDYAFARRFVREGHDLTLFLTQDCRDQHLFRRAQVRQVLAYQRDDDHDRYLATLKHLLLHPGVRVHIKRLALDWLTQLDDPSPEEWAIIEPLLSHPQLQWGACSLLGRTVPWFDLLDRLGVLARLMDSPDAELVDRCFHGICCREVLAQRSTEVARLLHPYRALDGGWRRRFQEFLRSCDLHHSRKLFDLALELLGEGLFDDAGDLTWYSLTRLAERRADWAVEFFQSLLERLIHQSEARGESNPFTDRQHRDQGMVQFIRTAAANAPVDFAERVVPIIRQLALANARPAPQGACHDRIWLIVSVGNEYDSPSALLSSARRVLQSLARSDAPLPTESLVEARERVHRLPGRPCGRMICWVARAVVPRSLPERLIEIVAHYAIHDSDPETADCNQLTQGGTRRHGYDPLSAGINTVRGGAASAIARFLFEHPDLADRFLPLVESLARDRSVAVRAANLEGLLALLNTRPDTAIELFLETCEGAESLWATRLVEDFLYYATFTHYPRLRPVLHRMLTASEAETGLSTGRQISLAAFRHPEAQEDLCLVLRGDEECRRAAAEIYSANVHHPSVREICIRHLATLFNAPSKRVREAARDWLRERSGEWTDWQRNLLAAFIQSAGFPDAGAECALSLGRTPGPLPPEFLAYAERALIVFEDQSRTSPPHALGIAYGLPALLLRFYKQSKDPTVRTHCLDLLDRMLALGWGEAAAELVKGDR